MGSLWVLGEFFLEPGTTKGKKGHWETQPDSTNYREGRRVKRSNKAIIMGNLGISFVGD